MKKILLLTSLLLMTPPCGLYAAPPTRTSSYVTGATIRAADVTGNENSIFNYLQAGVDTIADGSIVNADVSASAAIAYSKLSLTGTIVNADISASAAIVYSKLSLANTIVNADISTSAAIADSKLAQITTASKVSGTSITGLASLPSGAGVIPTANLGSGTPGVGNYLSGAQTYTTPPGNSNVLFQYSAQTTSTGMDIGEYAGTSYVPNAVTGNYRFLQSKGGADTYATIWTTKWIKTSGVSTITIYGEIWNRASGTSTLKVDVGGANGSAAGTATQATPEWVTFTIDVSGLSNGTAYTVTAYTKSSANETNFMGNLIAFGS